MVGARAGQDENGQSCVIIGLQDLRDFSTLLRFQAALPDGHNQSGAGYQGLFMGVLSLDSSRWRNLLTEINLAAKTVSDYPVGYDRLTIPNIAGSRSGENLLQTNEYDGKIHGFYTRSKKFIWDIWPNLKGPEFYRIGHTSELA